MNDYIYALSEWFIEIEEKLEATEFTPQLIALFVVGLIVALVVASFIKRFMKKEYKKSKGKFLLKTAIASIAPIAFCVPLAFKKVLPLPLLIIIEIITLAGVFAWDFKGNNKIFATLVHTLLYGFFGCCVGMLFISIDFWIIGLFALFFSLVKGGVDLNKEISVSKSTPEYITDSETGETYRVEKGSNGNTYIQKNGESVPIYNGAFSNDYNDGNSSYHSN